MSQGVVSVLQAGMADALYVAGAVLSAFVAIHALKFIAKGITFRGPFQ